MPTLYSLIETYTLMAMNAAGVEKEEAEKQARVVAHCVVADMEAMHVEREKEESYTE